MNTIVEELHAAVDSISMVETAKFNQEGGIVNLTLDHADPWRTVELQLSEDYIKRYPYGMCSFVVGSRYYVITAAEALRVHDVLLRVIQTVKFEMSDASSSGMGSAMNTAISWAVEPTFEMPSSGNGGATEGGFLPGIHASIVEGIAAVSPAQITAVDDHHALDLTRLVFNLPISFTTSQLEAYDLTKDSPLLVELRLCRSACISEKRCTVEVGQKRNFNERNFCGASGTLTLIAQRFLDTYLKSQPHGLRQLFWEGYTGDVVVATLRSVAETEEDISVRLEKCKQKLRDDGVPQAPRCKDAPANDDIPFTTQLLTYLSWRLQDLPSNCALCDERHRYKAISRLSLCNAPFCQFRYESLGLGKNFGLQQVMQSGVADLLVNLAIAAATSGRWKDIFNPYPSIASTDGNPPIEPATKEIHHALVQRVLSSFPSTFVMMSSNGLQSSLSGLHAIAPKLFDWILASNATQLVKMENDALVPCMKTRHQFMMSGGSDERAEKFRRLISQHGYVWSFHGSRVENWHSILRNGLRNVSGTTLQVNGAAYGHGVYLSPHSSVSVSYSNMSNNSTPQATEYNQSHSEESKFLDRGSMRCIAVCQVANTGIQKNGNIWVQPDENAVFTRFFFVFNKGLGLPMVDTETDVVRKEFDKVFEECVASGMIK